jgi:uncharacterized membrane protein YdjX (TVP38/TMEM64 family)
MNPTILYFGPLIILPFLLELPFMLTRYRRFGFWTFFWAAALPLIGIELLALVLGEIPNDPYDFFILFLAGIVSPIAAYTISQALNKKDSV